MFGVALLRIARSVCGVRRARGCRKEGKRGEACAKESKEGR